MLALTTVLLLAGGPPATAPAAPPAGAICCYAVFLERGPRFDPALPPFDQPGFEAHAAHVEDLEARGLVLVGGPLLEPEDGPLVGALLLLRAASAGEARALAEADPGVVSGLLVLGPVRRFQPMIGQR